MIMGDNYSILYFSDSDYDADSSGIDKELGRGTNSSISFFTYHHSTLLLSISSGTNPIMADEW